MNNMDFKNFDDFENRFQNLYAESKILNGCIENIADNGLTPERRDLMQARLDRIKDILDTMGGF